MKRFFLIALLMATVLIVNISFSQPAQMAIRGAAIGGSETEDFSTKDLLVKGRVKAISADGVGNPIAGIATGTRVTFNESTENHFGVGLGSQTNGLYPIWYQSGVQNGGGHAFYKGSNKLGEITASGTLFLQNRTAAPVGLEGSIYYDSTTKHFYGHNGTSWIQLDN